MSTAAIPSPRPPADSLAQQASSVLIQEQIEIPLTIRTLEDFREWARSDSFPEQGRIDYINGRIEVDMMVENIFYHALPKSEIARVILNRVHQDKSGDVAIDRTRLSNQTAKLSTEPDLVFISDEAFKSGRVTLTPAQGDDPDSFIEIDGSPDWVCEIVSDGSQEKDLVRLMQTYFAAGIREYWTVDARGEELSFAVWKRSATAFEISQVDAEGFAPSAVFHHRYRFSRERSPLGHWRYTLDELPLN
jgi:Uma2 family endonuclease